MSAYLSHSFAVIVTSWLEGPAANPHAFPFVPFKALECFISAWVSALARRVGRAQAAPLLAAPTHAGGWIDPRVFVERFRRRCQLPIADEPGDLILAILRLAPDHRPAALADARDLRGEQGAAIRHALGGDGETIGPSNGLWVAAARARAPWDDDPAVEAKHPGLGPDAGRAANYHIDGKQMIGRHGTSAQLRITRDPAMPEREHGLLDLPTVLFHSIQWLSGESWPNPPSLWPSALESFFAVGAQQFVESSEATSDWQRSRGFLLPMLDPDVPLRPMARLLLALGLASKLPEIAGLATDVLAAAIEDGRLDAQTLGQSLLVAWQLRVETWAYRPINDPLRGVPTSEAFVKPGRWAKTLGDVSRISPLHAGVIAGALEHVLADETTGNRTPASVLPLLELVREASIESGRAVSALARNYLGKLGTTGKTGRVARELLALPDAPLGPARTNARTQTLANRIARAERWAAREE